MKKPKKIVVPPPGAKMNPGGPTVPPGAPEATSPQDGKGAKLKALKGRQGRALASVLGKRLAGLKRQPSEEQDADG